MRPSSKGAATAAAALAASLLWASPAHAAVYGHDVTAQAGLTQTTMTFDAAVADYDQDGDEDFLLGRHGQGPARLYRNDGARFVEVFPGLFKKVDRHRCTWGDPNDDGRPDVHCTIGGARGTATNKSNELWLQQAGGGFVDVGAQWGISDPTGRGRDSVFLHANDDELDDLFVANNTERADELTSENRLFLNQGGTSYQSAPSYGLDTDFTATHADTDDYNGDGWDDVLHAGQQTKLFRNDAGQGFTDVTSAAGITGRAKQGLFADMNCDGRPDLVRVVPGKFMVHLQQPDGRYPSTSYQLALTTGHAVAVGDVDGVNCLDAYIVQTRKSKKSPEQPDIMLINDGTGRGYSKAGMDQTTAGAGNAVSAIDYDDDGLAEFLVMNGERDLAPNESGPVRLIDFR
jgi:hypothetical protein